MGILFGVLGAGLFIAGMSLNGAIAGFVDMPSLALVIGGSVMLTLAYHPWTQTKAAFQCAFSNDIVSAGVARKHLAVLSSARLLTSASGVLGIIIGMVNMLQNMDDPRAIGPAMAVALLTPFYAIILAELIIGPAMGRLRSRVSHGDPSDSTLKASLVTISVIPTSLIAFGVMLASISWFVG